MKRSTLLFTTIAAIMGFATVSQASISVGPAGTGVITFGSLPSSADFSTLSVAGANTDYADSPAGAAALDVNVKTKAASAITGTLSTSATVPPATGGTFQWNSTGLFLQSRPTANGYNLLMATLQNNSGGTLNSLIVEYDFAQDAADGAGAIIGHRAFFSLTGQPGCWQAIPEFTSVTAGHLTATLQLGKWANGATLYILWADDNAVVTEAGNEIDNFVANPGPATQTTYCWTELAGAGQGLASIYGVTYDTGSGLTYTVDLSSLQIKSITSAGVVNTLGATFSQPLGVVVNSTTHDIYVADNGATSIIRVVSPYGNGDKTTIDSGYGCAGTGIASDGTVYVGDITHGTIKKITQPGGVVTYLTGSGASTPGYLDGALAAARFNFPAQIAVNPTGDILYVADRNNNYIRKIDLTGANPGNEVSTLAGGSGACADGTGTAAKFDEILGCALGPDGNIYVPDQNNLRVCQITPAGVVTTIGSTCGIGSYALVNACGTAARFSNVSQAAVKPNGTVIVGDRTNGDVRQGAPPPVAVPLLITSITRPDAPAAPDTYCWTELAGAGQGLASVYGVCHDTGSTLTYTVDLSSLKIKSITTAGAVSTLAGPTFSQPLGIAVNSTTHDLYVADNGATAVKRIVSPYGAGDVTTIDSGYGTIGIGVDQASGTVYVADDNHGVIKKITQPGGVVTYLTGSGASTPGNLDGALATAKFSGAIAQIAVNPAGNILYVADRNNNTIRKIDLTGASPGNEVSTLAGGSGACADGTGTVAKFDEILGCALAPNGNIYVPDQNNLRVCQITPAAVVTTVGSECGHAPNYAYADGCGNVARFSNVSQAAVWADGTLVVGDRTNGDVRKGVFQAGAPGGPGPNMQIDFTAPNAAPCSFYLQCSADVNGTYVDCGTVTQLGANSYRALGPISGDTQFYRIRY